MTTSRLCTRTSGQRRPIRPDGANAEALSSREGHSHARGDSMKSLLKDADADALEAPCPVCLAARRELCRGPVGGIHSARRALRFAELAAQQSASLDGHE